MAYWLLAQTETRHDIFVSQDRNLGAGSGFSVSCMGAGLGSVLLMVYAGNLISESGLSRFSLMSRFISASGLGVKIGVGVWRWAWRRSWARRCGLVLVFRSASGFGVIKDALVLMVKFC